MEFYKVSGPEPVADYLARKIGNLLKGGKQVLWLVPGSSAIPIVVQTSRKLKGSDLQCLTVTLTDERYGPVSHSDSNWQQLIDAGLELPGATLVPVLSGKSRKATTEDFANLLEKYLNESDFTLGLFGMGADGHTAGFVPGSPALNSSAYATSYQGPDFERITITPKAVTRLDEVTIYATGEAKWRQLDMLEKNLSIEEQPAQALKKVSQLRIYNDYKGEEV